MIQPYIKWGPSKSNVSPDIKLQEAEDLIRSLDTWNINDSLKVPLVGFKKHTFFGRGKIDEIRRMVVKHNGDHIKKVRFCLYLNRPNSQLISSFFSIKSADILCICKCKSTEPDTEKQFGIDIRCARNGSIFNSHSNIERSRYES